MTDDDRGHFERGRWVSWADILRHVPTGALVEAMKACDDVEAEVYDYRDPVTNEGRQCLLLYVGGI